MGWTFGAVIPHLAVAAFLVGAGLAQTQDGALKTSREWKRLRARAHTSGDFEKLARWCTSQAEVFRKKADGYEAELKEYDANPASRPVPKYPPAGQTLKILIAHYLDLSRSWDEMARAMSAKAAGLKTAEAGK